MAKPNSYIAGLDGLRAIAVLSVFIGHTLPGYLANAVGVDIFFALSGFLITRGLLAELEGSGGINLRAFYWRRALRLFPAQLVVVAATLLGSALLWFVFQRRSGGQSLFAAAAALSYTSNWIRAFDLGDMGWFGHTWSLAIEEQFYLLWPLILALAFRLGGRKAALIVAVSGILLSIAWRVYLIPAGEMRIYNGFDTRADGLLMGCALALGHSYRWSIIGRLWPIGALVIGAVFIFVPWLSLWTLPGSLITAATVLVMIPLCAGTNPRMATVLEYPPLRYIGVISYGLYLWHFPVMMALMERGVQANSVLLVTGTGALTLLGAAASYHFIEKPLGRFKHRAFVTRFQTVEV